MRDKLLFMSPILLRTKSILSINKHFPQMIQLSVCEDFAKHHTQNQKKYNVLFDRIQLTNLFWK